MNSLSTFFEIKTHRTRPARHPKPFPVNLGNVNEAALASIVQCGHPQLVAVEEACVPGSAKVEHVVVTPAVAKQALEAKKRELDAERHYQLGHCCEALQAYYRAIAIAPYEDDILYLSVGVVLSELGEHEKAHQYFAAALEIDPRNKWITRQLEPAQPIKRYRHDLHVNGANEQHHYELAL